MTLSVGWSVCIKVERKIKKWDNISGFDGYYFKRKTLVTKGKTLVTKGKTFVTKDNSLVTEGKQEPSESKVLAYAL